MDQKPSVGRIVHFRSTVDGACLAAIVCGVLEDGYVNLAGFTRDGAPLSLPAVAPDEWHWPERA